MECCVFLLHQRHLSNLLVENDPWSDDQEQHMICSSTSATRWSCDLLEAAGGCRYRNLDLQSTLVPRFEVARTRRSKQSHATLSEREKVDISIR